tara:strand:- start:338 stop:1300 length:963 start_codon:yes stop_codon:yes gene_type:complete
MADRYPLVVASSTVQELAAGDNLDLQSSNVVNAGITSTATLKVGIGTSGSPTIVGTANSVDGISFLAEGRVNISVGGSEAMRITHVNAVGMNTVGVQTTVYQPVISIGDGDQDLSVFDGSDPANYTDRYPLLHIDDSSRKNRNVPGAVDDNPNAGGGTQKYGFGPDPNVPFASGRMQASLAGAAKIYQVVIPNAHIGHYYCLTRNDVAGYRGLVDVEASDSVGGATSTVRCGLFGHYGNSTGFTTMAQSNQGANGGDMGIRFKSVNLQTLGITTQAGAGLAVGWSTISGISTDKAALNITMIGYNAMPNIFFAGTLATTS